MDNNESRLPHKNPRNTISDVPISVHKLVSINPSSTISPISAQTIHQTIMPNMYQTNFGSSTIQQRNVDLSTVDLAIYKQMQSPQSDVNYWLVIFYTIFFKCLIIVAFYYGTTISYQSILQSWVAVIFGSFDYWLVKNVIARVLLGQRWWVEFDNEGEEQWVFETRIKQLNNRFESLYFWLVQYIYIVLCILMIIASLITFQLTLTASMTFIFVLTGVNIWAYQACSNSLSGHDAQYLLSVSKLKPMYSIKLKMF